MKEVLTFHFKSFFQYEYKSALFGDILLSFKHNPKEASGKLKLKPALVVQMYSGGQKWQMLDLDPLHVFYCDAAWMLQIFLVLVFPFFLV